MLYDGAIRSIAQAKEACENGEIQEKFNKLVNAGDIIMGLQASLDFDTGGDVAKALYDFYAYADARIMKFHRQKDTKGYDLLITELKQLRSEWSKIDNGDTDTEKESENASDEVFSEATEYSVQADAEDENKEPPSPLDGLPMNA